MSLITSFWPIHGLCNAIQCFLVPKLWPIQMDLKRSMIIDFQSAINFLDIKLLFDNLCLIIDVTVVAWFVEIPVNMHSVPLYFLRL
jgi:hypothetical protein